jgi:hypothetical protein
MMDTNELREWAENEFLDEYLTTEGSERINAAADLIDALRARIVQLKTALREIIAENPDPKSGYGVAIVETATAALERSPGLLSHRL